MIYSLMGTDLPRGIKAVSRNAWLHVILIVILGIAAYSNTFGVPFQFDDNLFVNNLATESPETWDIPHLLSVFIDTERPFGSRPLLNASLLLNYYIGGMNTWGYHAINLLLHSINGVLLYSLVVMTGRRLARSEDDVRLVAVLGSLLFVLHPVQTEAVTNIIGRSMLFSATFFLSGLILFAKAVESTRRRVLYDVGLLLVSLAGAASRENFSAFPLVLLLYDLFFVSRFRLGTVARHLREYLAVIPGIIYLAFLILNSTYDRAEHFGPWVMSAREYLLTGLHVFWTYLRLLVLPVGQNLDYDYPITQTLFEMPTLLCLAGYLGLLAGGIALARKTSAISFGILWFLLTLAPVSFGVVFAGSLLDVRLGDVIFEHRLYLPSVGPMVLAAAALLQLSRLRSIAVPAVVAIVLLLGGATHARNALWKDGIALWGDVVAKSPNKARGHNNLGIFYYDLGYTDSAIEHIRAALRLNPNGKYHYNLGMIYASADSARDPAKAMKHLETALQLGDPAVSNAQTLFRVHTSLGNLYMEQGLYKNAVFHFHRALMLQPNPPELAQALYNLGTAYEKTGKAERALEFYLAVLRTQPGDAALHNRIANIYGATGHPEKAQEHRRKAQDLAAETGRPAYNYPEQ